ncbi:unnamed protein product [Chrysoparadoxa australica]
MGDAKYWDTSYGKALGELETLLGAAESASGSEREKKIGSAGQTIRRLQGMKRSYNLEIKLMKDAISKTHFQSAKASKDGQLEELMARLERVKAMADEKETLFAGAREVEMTNKKSTPDAKLTEAEDIQDKTESTYKNIVSVLQETEVTATTTAQTLVEQREQVNNMQEDLMELDSMLTRADKLVRVFSKRMMTDKFIQCFGCLNIVIMVTIIIYVVVQKVGLPGGNDEDIPPSPVDDTISAQAL